MKNKKGVSVWVSAVLYFGIGMVILTLILTAGMPVINRLRDKNIAIQTKEVFHTLDKNIRDVAREGPGSQRVLSLDLTKGTFIVNAENDNIEWNYTTTAILSEPGEPVQEGNIMLLTSTTPVTNEYMLYYNLSYKEKLNITIDGQDYTKQLSGPTDLSIKNEGVQTIAFTEL